MVPRLINVPMKNGVVPNILVALPVQGPGLVPVNICTRLLTE